VSIEVERAEEGFPLDCLRLRFQDLQVPRRRRKLGEDPRPATADVSPLELPQIRATSPTLAETMRVCFLRAGLSRATGGSRFVLGNPKAWLGTAYHEVLEKIVEVDLGQETLDEAVERLWNQAIATSSSASARTLRYPGSMARLPRGARKRRASRTGALVAPAAKQASGPGLSGSIREQEFTACGGKLAGRPDVIRASEVVDYKSGAIVEYDEATQADVVKAAYIRQLRIYGYLVKEKLGWWPLRGRCNAPHCSAHPEELSVSCSAR